MKSKYIRKYLCTAILIFIIFFSISGCKNPNLTDSEKNTASTSVRSNTPNVRVPKAENLSVIGSDPLIVDTSHTDQGYIMVRYNGTASKASVQITGTDDITYKYFLSPSDTYVSLPLTSGDGTYTIQGYENITGSQYAVLFKETIEVSLANEFLPFLYPNQYVSFTSNSLTVQTASDIVKNAASDLDAVKKIYHYIIKNIHYDSQKAQSVSAGYLPNVDTTLTTKSGICFDYASLTAAMLRSQNIPAKLEIGYAGDIYHAWISVYIKDIGWIDKLIEFTGDTWTRMDPTFASNNDNSKQILKYIGDGSNYSLQYTR